MLPIGIIDLHIVKYSYFPAQADILATPLLLGALLWLSIIDLRERRLPNPGTVLLVAIGLALGAWRARGVPVDNLMGATVGYGTFALIGWLYFWRNGVEGLGLGDAKLFGALGAWLGWTVLPAALLISSVLALAFAIVSKTTRRQQLPFGPFISIGFVLLWTGYLMQLV